MIKNYAHQFIGNFRFVKKIALFALSLASVFPSSEPVNANDRNMLHTTVRTLSAEACAPVSPLPCSALQVPLPFNLTFNAPVSGSIGDKNGAGTGFTTVNTFSGKRTSQDGAPSVPAVPGYEPSKITVTGGTLQLISGKGIDYLTNNNQINVLGVKVAPAKKLRIETVIINPFNASQAQQGGLWYGLNDKTFIKLGVTGNKVELRKELNDVSSTISDNTNPDQRKTETITGLNTKTVYLRMEIDSVAKTVQGFYSTDGSTYINAGAAYPVSSLSLTGTGLTAGTLYAGIFGTYRNGTTPVTYTFDNFSVYVPAAVPVQQEVKVNFQPAGSALVSGYQPDYGNAFDTGRKYGWVNAATKVPGDYSGNTRIRSGTADLKQLSLLQIQSTTENTIPGAWEHTVANGTYRVTVSAGDFKYFDSKHQINVESLPAITDFTPTSAEKFLVATAVVNVTDGKLTIDATGGSVTKINYVEFRPATSVADAVAPTASARFEGTLLSSGVYDQNVKVVISARDGGESGLASLQYSINNGAYQNYSAPFTIETAGTYSLKVKAVDAANNQTITSPYNFSVYRQPVSQTVKINFQPHGKVPDGFVADYGNAFDAVRKYGWLNAATKVPADYSGNTRLRSGSAEPAQLSLIQMQSSTENSNPGAWEYTVENGTYRVTVSAGDYSYYSSKHQINVEGLPAISDFIPNTSSRFSTATAMVTVNDGKLTIDATGGIASKLNYVIFEPASPVADTIAPVASARFEGSLLSEGVFDKNVKVNLKATDAGASGLASLQYSLNNGNFLNYTVPFSIETAGSYQLRVKAKDANQNESAIASYNFTVYNESASETVQINFQPGGSEIPAGYVADLGKAFDETRKYGWINVSTKEPESYESNTVLRSGAGDLRQLSFVKMQSDAGNTNPGAWEYIIANGTYAVTVSAGDAESFDSNHQVNVEGLPAISDFTPNVDNRFRIAVATVQVTDGKLTIDAAGGRNTKLNYIVFKPYTAVADSLAPVVTARFEGQSDSATVYNNEVKIFVSAADQGGAGLSELQYSINNSSFTAYKTPVVISAPGNYTLKMRAVDAQQNERVTENYFFKVVAPVVPESFTFSKPNLDFTVIKGQTVQSQTVTIASTPAASSFTLSKTEAAWLTLPANTSGPLEFGPAQISSNLEPGTYQALVTAQAAGHTPATMLINLHVVAGLEAVTTRINFQDAATASPIGYFRDYGQAYGLRNGTSQGAGLYYGWKTRADGSPLNLTLNGRNRNTPEDVLLATLMHMQANHIVGTSSTTTQIEGYWEMKVPNGTYDVTVSVGDGTVNTSPEVHNINIEGLTVINGFVPNGKKGTISRFKSETMRVHVTDELLTINADGGTNTKINYANIFPVTLDRYVYWANTHSNILIKKETTESNILKVVLGSSDNTASSFNLSATYQEQVPGWLQFNANQTGTQPVVNIDYTAAKDLPVGIYHATIRAASGQSTSADLEIQIHVVEEGKPYVVSSNPSNGSSNISLNTVSIAANNLHVPAVEGFQGGVDNSTITNSTVKLLKLTDNAAVAVNGVVQGTGGGDVISFSPSARLEANTMYRFMITSGVKSYSGASFSPYEATFTTAAAVIDSSNFLNATFTKVPMAGTENKKYTSVTFGPDGKFYALRLDGVIEKYTVNPADGVLSNQVLINTLVTKYGDRSAIGLVFDPASRADNLIAWVTHSSSGLTAAPSFDGNVSRLSGNLLQIEQMFITKLPRSKRDHLTNSVAFGPDGALYITQGSNSSAGSYDADWQRDESLLAGTVLRLDLNKLNGLPLPIDVQTTSDQLLINSAPADSIRFRDGTYNPYSVNSPLTIYASGVRNAYDLLWHSNGQLYLPTNGSGGGGNSPASVAGTRRPDGTAYNGPVIPATNTIKAQNDWLFRVNPAKSVGFFGHPNPLRGEYVLNRGYPDNPLYLPSIQPDANYRIGYNFGLNNSPNGVIEYKSNNFNGVLKNKLLVCRFSGGGDIVVMEPGSMTRQSAPAAADSIYNIIKVNAGSGNMGLSGMSGFGNPLDLTEDVTTGNLYVIEYNWNDSPNLVSRITLLRAQGQGTSAPAMTVRMNSEANDNNARTKRYEVVVANEGDADLEIKNIDLGGEDASAFRITGLDQPSASRPLVLPAGASRHFTIVAPVLPERTVNARLSVTSMDNTIRQVEINNVHRHDVRQLNADYEGNTDHVVQLYPNPSAGNEPVTIRLLNFNRKEPVTVYIYDMLGNVVQSVSMVTDGKGELTAPVNMRSGLRGRSFILKVTYPAGFRFVKWVNL